MDAHQNVETSNLVDVSIASKSINRIESIDVLRALTMVMMIFVNDLGSLRKIPEWLDHVKADVDGIGLADTVFPAFLFLVGLSLPYAIAHRLRKGDSLMLLIAHILSRSFALIIMGVFLVNGETINSHATGFDHYIWNTLCCISFILIWNVYPLKIGRHLKIWARVTGVVLLCLLAFIYRGSENGIINRFAAQWWGILGLIGWAYLATAIITVFLKDRLWLLILVWALFSGISLLYTEEIIGHTGFFWFVPAAIIDGSLTGLIMGGVIIATLFERLRRKHPVRMTFLFIAIFAFLIGLCYYSHNFYIISKIDASLPWVYLCTAITLLAFTAIYWLTDVLGKASWFSFIKPAGTDTLLCYLIPYLLVSLVYASHLKIPFFFLTGTLGLVKSFLFAMACVWITAGLNKIGIRLKL